MRLVDRGRWEMGRNSITLDVQLASQLTNLSPSYYILHTYVAQRSESKSNFSSSFSSSSSFHSAFLKFSTNNLSYPWTLEKNALFSTTTPSHLSFLSLPQQISYRARKRDLREKYSLFFSFLLSFLLSILFSLFLSLPLLTVQVSVLHFHESSEWG